MDVFRTLVVAMLATCLYSTAKAWDYKHINEWWREAPACAGFKQSPINFSSSLSYQESRPLKIVFEDGSFLAHPHDNGHTSGLTFNSKQPRVIIGARKYWVTGLHFHHISEHTLNKKHFDAELHITLTADKKHIDHVIAILLKRSKTMPSLQKVIGITGDKEGSHQYFISSQELNELLPQNKSYYQYVGSLTTPPCTEGIVWYVLSTPMAISYTQLKTLKDLHAYNFRPTNQHQESDIEFHH